MSLIEISASFETYAPSFADVLGDAPRLEKVLDVDAHEGPVYVEAEDALYFTSFPKPGPQVSIKRLDLETLEVSVARRDANGANGMTLDRKGRLIVCEQGSLTERARISRFDPVSGWIEAIADEWDGLPLNSPNDVVVGSDGTIWFTDPSYGSLQGFRPAPSAGDNVYRHDPATGRTTVVSDSFDKPNGLAFSPDERLLYVGDSGANQEAGSYYPERPHHIRVFAVADGEPAGDHLFAVTNPGYPDGLKVDSAGRVYASSASGVQVFASTGVLLGEIRLPGAVNFTFGGADRSTLFITTDTAIWAATLGAKGA